MINFIKLPLQIFFSMFILLPNSGFGISITPITPDNVNAGFDLLGSDYSSIDACLDCEIESIDYEKINADIETMVKAHNNRILPGNDQFVVNLMQLLHQKPRFFSKEELIQTLKKISELPDTANSGDPFSNYLAEWLMSKAAEQQEILDELLKWPDYEGERLNQQQLEYLSVRPSGKQRKINFMIFVLNYLGHFQN